LRSGQIEVPAGKYDGAWLVQEMEAAPPGKLVRKVWYADKVGPLKIETTRNRATAKRACSR
jgi:hypothetical protein